MGCGVDKVLIASELTCIALLVAVSPETRLKRQKKFIWVSEQQELTALQAQLVTASPADVPHLQAAIVRTTLRLKQSME